MATAVVGGLDEIQAVGLGAEVEGRGVGGSGGHPATTDVMGEISDRNLVGDGIDFGFVVGDAVEVVATDAVGIGIDG